MGLTITWLSHCLICILFAEVTEYALQFILIIINSLSPDLDMGAIIRVVFLSWL